MAVELTSLVAERIKTSLDQIAEFCQRWHIAEFALFGSVLRDDFCPDSDIDVLLTFDSQYPTNWDDRIKMQAEIEQLFRRNVDLVNKKYLKNPYRRHEILSTCEVVYAAE
ncbi:MAG: nucleotidyltransferase domain-containing protein [Tildeniella torsiva UHER 1998/13D]|nr:nucleotidyltransferase domain-containing protein [Tildeniella torsiva UHER 1998/13D]